MATVYHIPFYLWIKQKSSSFHFDFATYVDESFVDDLGMQPYPYINLNDIHPYFYFDGFDEIAEKMSPDEIERISISNMFCYPVLLTCRRQYYSRYVNNFTFSDKFGVKIEVQTWNIDKAKEYISNFYVKNNDTTGLADKVYTLLADNKSLQGTLNNPLLITMMLWIVEQNRMTVPATIHTYVELFTEYIDLLAKRELYNLGQSETLSNALVDVWSYAAWNVFFNRLTRGKTKLSHLISTLKTQIPSPLDYNESYFEILFDCNSNYVRVNSCNSWQTKKIPI